MKKILCLALSLCLLITSCGLITLPSQAETPETGVNLIGYYNKTTGTVKTSDYDTSTANDLNHLTAERGGFTYSFVPMTPPLADADKAANPDAVVEGKGAIFASRLTQTLKDFEDPNNAAYGSWLVCADNKTYYYHNNVEVVPSYLDGALLFPPNRSFVRAVAGLQNGHTYQISVDHYGYGGAPELYLGLIETAYSVETPTDSGKIAVTRAAWNTATFTVKNTATDDNGMTYLQLCTKGPGKVRIENLSVVDITKSITVTSNHAKWGAASADKSIVAEAEAVTLTATPYGDAAFEGWYNGDSLVSQENPYTFTATGSVNYIAKFSSSNLIGTGETNYDSPTFEEFPVNTNLRIEPKTYDTGATLSDQTPAADIPNTLNAFKNNAETYGQWLPQYIAQDLTYAYAGWGDSVLKVSANPVAASEVNTSAKCLQLGWHSRQYVRRVDGLTPGKAYKFSFKYYVGGANTGETVFAAAILDEASAFEKYMPDTSTVKFNANSDWATGEFVYQHPVNSESSSAFIKLNARDSGSSKKNYYIDDLSLTEVENTSVVDKMVGFNGNAMRTTGNQALRFKFYVPDEFKTESGYAVHNKEVSELGFLVQYKAILGGSELVLDGKYNYNGKGFGVNKGVGYNNKGTNIVFEERDGKTYYSAALFNIGAKGDGTVNYNYYSQALCVRPYIKLVDGTVLYGSVQESTVFDTMAYILDETHSGVLEADRTAIQALLAENTDLKNAYDSWKQ